MGNIKTPSSVTNFPRGYPWYKKWASNIIYWISQIPLWPRGNRLSRADIRKMRHLIQDGDIILGGTFHEASRLFIEGIVTHAIAYLGKGRCIHAVAHGVSFISLRKIWRSYDSVIILRPYWKGTQEKRLFREILISRLGRPYDFFFGLEKEPEEAYYCTEFINESLSKIGYQTGLNSLKHPEGTLDTLFDDTFRAHRALLPEDMLSGNFNIIFHSGNIMKQDSIYILKDEKKMDK